jgi:uncharacterized membrane protein YphA (DoxX/SURF4 family)
MKPSRKALKITGVVLNLLVAAPMFLAGSAKVFGFDPKVAEMLKTFGLGDHILLIGAGEIVSALLMLIPYTSPLGTLVVSGFWGGAICIHMSHATSFAVPSVLLALTWLGSYLRGSVPLFAVQQPTSAAPPT